MNKDLASDAEIIKGNEIKVLVEPYQGREFYTKDQDLTILNEWGLPPRSS